MGILKYFNHIYSSGVPIGTGDRYYSQDLGRDFHFLRDSAGRVLRDLLLKFPVCLSGGVVTAGTYPTLNITAGYGYGAFNVTIPDSFSSLPPTTTTADIDAVRIAWAIQTGMGSGSPKVANWSVNNDGSTLNYVKVRYYEADGNTRNRAKKAGSYSYEKVPDYRFYVNTTAPTDYDVCLATFTSNGSAFTIVQSPYRAQYYALYGSIPVGTVRISAAYDPEPWEVLADGSSLSRTLYSTLYNKYTTSKGACTMTIASPCVVTLSGHGLLTGHCIEFTTTGALPTGLSVNTNYYIEYINSSTFYLHATLASALLGAGGTRINTSGSQSGTHSLRFCPWGISGANNFLLPNFQAVVPKGAGTQTINTRSKTAPPFGGVEEDREQSHIHQHTGIVFSGGLIVTGGVYSQGTVSSGTQVTDGSNGTPRTGATTRENSVGVNFFIKFE